MEKIAFCVITFHPIKIKTHSAPQNDRLNFSFVKNIHIVGKKKWLEMVVIQIFRLVANFGHQALGSTPYLSAIDSFSKKATILDKCDKISCLSLSVLTTSGIIWIILSKRLTTASYPGAFILLECFVTIRSVCRITSKRTN